MTQTLCDGLKTLCGPWVAGENERLARCLDHAEDLLLGVTMMVIDLLQPVHIPSCMR
jgi:hypothetical protein